MRTLDLVLRALLALAIAPVTSALSGCATPAYKQGDSAADTMLGAEQNASAVVASAKNAQTYLASLAQGEVKPLFARFEREVDSFDSSLRRLRGSINGVRSRTNGYVSALKQTSASLSSADLKAKTDARVANITQQLSEIDGRAAEVDSIATEISGQFADLRTFMRADLSMRAVADSASSRAELDAAIARLDAAVGGLKRELADVKAAIASGS